MTTKKFRVYESDWLAKQYSIVGQFTKTILSIAENAETPVENLPESSISTEVLLDLCFAYAALYEASVDKELLSKVVSTKTIH